MEEPSVTFVRCLKCGKVLQCSRNDTTILLEHIRTDHPDVMIKDDKSEKANGSGNRRKDKPSSRSQPKNKDKENENIDPGFEDGKETTPRRRLQSRYNTTYEEENSNGKQLSPKSSPGSPKTKVIYTSRRKLKTPSPLPSKPWHQQPQQHRQTLYRTTIERWRPVSGTIYCPLCGCNKKPLLKTRLQSFTRNQCCACCLFSCWPFCFAPCLLPDMQVEYLHCANCKGFLGIYNRNSNCIKPNRDFSKCSDSPENASNCQTGRSSGCSSTTTKHLPSIVIDGKELHPNVVARLHKYGKIGQVVGIDLDAVQDCGNASQSEDMSIRSCGSPECQE